MNNIQESMRLRHVFVHQPGQLHEQLLHHFSSRQIESRRSKYPKIHSRLTLPDKGVLYRNTRYHVQALLSRKHLLFVP